VARVKLVVAMHINQYRLKAGSTIADSAGNAQPGDFVWSSLSSSTWNPGMVALDGPANTMKAASIYANVSPPGTITGRDSIDA
jgi:hypothetical protein